MDTSRFMALYNCSSSYYYHGYIHHSMFGQWLDHFTPSKYNVAPLTNLYDPVLCPGAGSGHCTEGGHYSDHNDLQDEGREEERLRGGEQ